MGIFSKLKNLTGGWADVKVTADETIRGGSSEVMIQVSVGEEPIEIKRIYLKLKCVEEVTVPNQRIDDPRADGRTRFGTVSATEVLHQKEYTAAGATRLDAGINETVTCSIDVPGQLPPSFDGRNARIRWLVKAGLDMSGNDPDSGWQSIPVK